MLETRQIYKQYQSGTTTLEVLRGVDFLLEQGGFLAVVGQSGSGKSTLLHVMGLLDAPDRGEVWLDGRRIDNLSIREKDFTKRLEWNVNEEISEEILKAAEKYNLYVISVFDLLKSK